MNGLEKSSSTLSCWGSLSTVGGTTLGEEGKDLNVGAVSRERRAWGSHRHQRHLHCGYLGRLADASHCLCQAECLLLRAAVDAVVLLVSIGMTLGHLWHNGKFIYSVFVPGSLHTASRTLGSSGVVSVVCMLVR